VLLGRLGTVHVRPKYLVRPVLEPGRTKIELYLPRLENGAKWKSFSGEKAFEGGATVEVDCPLSDMPVFVTGDLASSE
jgi:alpha-D-xyloside xylohydrolase